MSIPSQIAQSIKNQAQKVLVTGQRFTRFDQVRQRHFWSTYRFIPDSNGYIRSGDFEIFQTPQGQQGQGFNRQLSLDETNWPSANRVPDNQNFEITEIGCTATTVFVSDDGTEESPYQSNWANYAQAEAQVLANTIVNITYLTNTVPLGLAVDFAQASGPQAGFYAPNAPRSYPLPAGPYASAATDPTRNFVTNGFAAPGLRRRFKIPILLQHGETFKFTLGISAGRGPFISPNGALTEVENIHLIAMDVRMDFWATESFVENS